MGTHAYPIGTTKIEFTRYKNIVYALRTQLKRQKMSDDIRNNISVPHIHDTHLDAEYGEWLESLKARYQ